MVAVVTPAETAKQVVAADLRSTRFRAGMATGRWRLLVQDFPAILIAVTSVEPDGRTGEYAFKFELDGYPGLAPSVFIWDVAANMLLEPKHRPKGSNRVQEAFKTWGSNTVYRPWDRAAGAHNNWSRDYPQLAWHSARDITYILEDLHGILSSNLLAHSPGT